MKEVILTTETGDSMAQNCLDLSKLLRLAKPVPEAVFISAVQDPEYARNLMLCRDSPLLLDFLLQNPPYHAESGQDTEAQQSTPALVARASKSFWKWAKSGFGVIDEETYAKRLNACLACPHLIAPPSKIVYKLVGADEYRNKICDLCGCVASKKARLPHEACPDAHPGLPGMNRWGEPLDITNKSH